MTDTFSAQDHYWKKDKADKAALLVDCASYYKALYETLCHAKHSIFILGWDIDGRIELLRGEDAQNKKYAVALRELLCQKANENPDLEIYLNRWNYSIFFSSERESFSGWKWRMHTPPNIHYCADYAVPFGACHHQKIIVVDGQIAFCGGMDIALGRWDSRKHHIEERERIDPKGLFDHFKKQKPYEPYHDIQFMMSGPVVGALSELVRRRWKKGAGSEIRAIDNKPENNDLWPKHVMPDFEDIDIAAARTIPKTKKDKAVTEILQIYLEQIARAEAFIYIENQYLTCLDIANALSKRLKEKPDLKVLIVSCDRPRGIMEHKAMWTGRVKFWDTVSENAGADRFAVTYPVCKENGTKNTIHIHSKIMIIDDRYFQVGSANLNNRSMGFDTECDMIIQADDDQSRQTIRSLRNNLIREHTGREEEDIQEIIETSTMNELLEYQEQSRQHLERINNDPYRNEFLVSWAQKIGDPKKPLILSNFPVRQVVFAALAAVILGLLYYFFISPALPEEFRQIFTQENLTGYIESARNSSWSPFIISGIYLIAGMLFFSVMALNLVTAIVFGPLYGFLYACLGSLVSAAAGYGVGRLAGEKLSRWFKPVLNKVKSYSERGGVIGMTMVRMVPIAPYTAVNITFGMAQVGFAAYLFSTLLGLLPGITAKALFGGALGELFKNPEPKVIFYTLGTLVIWGLIIWGTHLAFKHFKQKGSHETA